MGPAETKGLLPLSVFFKKKLSFTPEEIAKRDPLTYMPFGFGPRHCLGRRLAELKIKVMLAILVKNFYFYPAPGDESVGVMMS